MAPYLADVKAAETPLMKQYGQIKQQHPEAILLFRLGDFYETFGQDAELTAKACGITLTKRNNGAAGEIPLAGFPHHQLDTYLPRLVQAGHRVAVCEQLEDPKQAKGIVRRGVVEIVTPGVVLYDKLLHHQRNTYACAVIPPVASSAPWGVAFLDVSTGAFFTGSVVEHQLASTLEMHEPAEILVPRSSIERVRPFIHRHSQPPAVTRIEDWHVDLDAAMRTLTSHFGTVSVGGFGIQDDTAGIVAAGVLLDYVAQAQQRPLRHITSIHALRDRDSMVLDHSTRRTLELVSTTQRGEQSGALVDCLDRTRTPMGSRCLRWWVAAPLQSLEAINERLEHVAAFASDPELIERIQRILSEMADIERLTARIAADRSTARDLSVLRRSLEILPELQACLRDTDSNYIRNLGESLDTHAELCTLLQQSIVDDPPLQLGTGMMFKPGYHAVLDQAAQAMHHGKTWVQQYQERERQSTGISTLKVGTNTVFGYYIEVSRTQSAKVPETYQRRQTLANAERYTTAELTDLEQTILQASSQLVEIEHELLSALRTHTAQHCAALQQTSRLVATIDTYVSLAQAALDGNFVRPVVHPGADLHIVDGRHPVLERILPPGTPYVANSLTLDDHSSQVQIITGPNMSGKSSYLRQTGIIVLLAHIGSFVPATTARIPLTDRIFTRVGAHDNLLAGESTFLVEMQETATILHNASNRSLILLDEVGRGTATFDGMSIAWSLAVYLHEVVGAKTLFATHYHELASLASTYKRITNHQVEVREERESIIFTHRVIGGHSDHSFGIHVARMAGVPNDVLSMATQVLHSLEQGTSAPSVEAVRRAPSTPVLIDPIQQRLKALDVHRITPIEAMAILAELQQLTLTHTKE